MTAGIADEPRECELVKTHKCHAEQTSGRFAERAGIVAGLMMLRPRAFVAHVEELGNDICALVLRLRNRFHYGIKCQHGRRMARLVVTHRFQEFEFLKLTFRRHTIFL